MIQKEDQNVDGHNCYSSGICQTKWGMLGCIKLYEYATTKERQNFLRKLKVCFRCGKKSNKDFHERVSGSKIWSCKVSSSAPAQCKENGCNYGAALCNKHPPNNAKQELVDWLSKNKIKTTVNAIIVTPKSLSQPPHSDDSPASQPTINNSLNLFLNLGL